MYEPDLTHKGRTKFLLTLSCLGLYYFIHYTKKMADIEGNLEKLLAGEVVPVGKVDISHKPGGQLAGNISSMTCLC